MLFYVLVPFITGTTFFDLQANLVAQRNSITPTRTNSVGRIPWYNYNIPLYITILNLRRRKPNIPFTVLMSNRPNFDTFAKKRPKKIWIRDWTVLKIAQIADWIEVKFRLLIGLKIKIRCRPLVSTHFSKITPNFPFIGSISLLCRRVVKLLVSLLINVSLTRKTHQSNRLAKVF